MDLGLRGKRALVTAASRGLGRACAATLAAEGAQVVIAARRHETLEQCAASLREATGSQVIAIPADLRVAGQIEALVQQTVAVLGGLEILVHNTGGPPGGGFEDCSDTHWQDAYDLVLLSAVRLVRAALPFLRQHPGEGRIIFLTSSAAKQPIAGLVLSNALRPGVVGLAKTLSRELASAGITVNSVCPGRIATERLRQGQQVQRALARGCTEEEAFQELAREVPLGRLGRPEEVGALVAFLASQQAGYITGAAIQVDGWFIQGLW
ncbi:MAG: SDR family oxidoreductase [Thermogemmatispora sp.]|uniref:SDR family oxidoreductase n=1 Tax=Thermogemmatispora sp. TaxID=1968838 RepID=UPI0019DD01F6|nr:SDR family oxidoreductase [Thermogemmatispora sp.]MBE3568230.1 SDR family oxidoreductase [Thermogemmatispora sp.]